MHQLRGNAIAVALGSENSTALTFGLGFKDTCGSGNPIRSVYSHLRAPAARQGDCSYFKAQGPLLAHDVETNFTEGHWKQGAVHF